MKRKPIAVTFRPIPTPTPLYEVFLPRSMRWEQWCLHHWPSSGHLVQRSLLVPPGAATEADLYWVARIFPPIDHSFFVDSKTPTA